MHRTTVGKQSSNLGFSLIELMVSVGIMATTLLLVLGIFTNVMRASRKAVDLTAGTIVAESVLTKELYRVMADEGAKARFFDEANNYDTNELVAGTEHLNDAVFTYRVYASNVSLGSTMATGNRVKKLDVVVWWWNSDEKGEDTTIHSQTREGFGFLRTEMTRLVNENSKY